MTSDSQQGWRCRDNSRDLNFKVSVLRLSEKFGSRSRSNWISVSKQKLRLETFFKVLAKACNTAFRTFNSSVSGFVCADHFCTGRTSFWSKWFAFAATSGLAIIRFALNVSLLKVKQKLCLIAIFAFSVHCSIKKFQFQIFFCFRIGLESRSRNCFVSVSTKRSRNFQVLISVSKTSKGLGLGLSSLDYIPDSQ